MRMVLIDDTTGFIRSAGILHWAVMLMVPPMTPPEPRSTLPAWPGKPSEGAVPASKVIVGPPATVPFKAAALFEANIFSVTRLVGGRPGTMGGVLERALGRALTTRNWNTIERIVSYADRHR